MDDIKVNDNGNLRKYFTQVPNLIDDMGLSVYAYRLYGHLKRVAGDNGKCWQSTRTLADECNISTASVSRAKEELVEKELITVTEKTGTHGGRAYHEIEIIDIWDKNFASYSEKQSQVSDSNLQVLPEKLASYPGEIKEEPSKNNPPEKEGGNGVFAEIVQLYQSQVGELNLQTADTIKEWIDNYPVLWVKEAIGEAKKNKARHPNYVTAVLVRWEKEGKDNGRKRKRGQFPPAEIAGTGWTSTEDEDYEELTDAEIEAIKKEMDVPRQGRGY